MKLIKPAEIAAKIMTIIDEAEKELIIISPYNNLSGWTKLINKIKKAQSRGVDIKWYSRKNNVDLNNAEEVRKNLGIVPILIDDLHAKMSKISDDKSLDLGFITETKEEYEEIRSFYKKHIVDVTGEKNQTNKIRAKSDLKIPPLDSDELWVNMIHKHIYSNYGEFKFNYLMDGPLEYFSFIKSGYNLQFIRFSQAIKVHLYIPSSVMQWDVERRIFNENVIRGLQKKDELEFCDDYLKYYYEDYYTKLSNL
jgi:hypothetical protein